MKELFKLAGLLLAITAYVALPFLDKSSFAYVFTSGMAISLMAAGLIIFLFYPKRKIHRVRDRSIQFAVITCAWVTLTNLHMLAHTNTDKPEILIKWAILCIGLGTLAATIGAAFQCALLKSRLQNFENNEEESNISLRQKINLAFSSPGKWEAAALILTAIFLWLSIFFEPASKIKNYIISFVNFK